MSILKFVNKLLWGGMKEEKIYYVLTPLEIHVMDKRALEYKFGGGVKGICKGHTIYTHYSGLKDINGNDIPDLNNLAHEILHLDELFGRWHK